MIKINKKLLASSAAFLLTISSLVAPVGNYGKAYASKNNMNSNNLESNEVIENKISPELKKEFDNKSQNSFLVKFKDQVDTVKVANEAKAKNKQLSNVKKELVVRSSIVSELRIKADSSQSNLKKYLVKEKNNGNVKDIKSFYIVNGMAVTATEEVMKNIAAMPEVESIKPNGITKLIEPEKTIGAAVQADDNTEWGLKKIGAPDVWTLGIDGTGIVVGSIDTGVQWDHPALKTKYRGYDPNNPDNPNNEFNWFDATETHGSVPYDDLGHGTHTVGTMVGSEPNGTNKIGVAPGAKWIAAKAFTKDGGNDADLIAAGEWMLAPKDRNGVPHPEMAPNVINNSWGGGPGVDDWYRTIIRNWRAANIVPVFAAGNTTPYNAGGPGSVANPGNYPESFTVGAVDINNNLAGFSLRGPSPYGGIIKPDISAPGVNIRSSVPGGVYEGGWNGTSMATPHTSGLVALLLQANSSLKVDDIERIIENTATPCTNADYPETPNNGYGHGVINAFKAVTSVMQGISEIKGQVSTDAKDTVPPTFKHIPVKETYEGLKQDLKIDVQDNVSVETVELQYRNNSSDEWTTVAAVRKSGDYKSGSYEAVIPADKVVAGSNLSYRWRIVDNGKNEVTSDIYTILVKTPITIGYFNDFETDMTGWESDPRGTDQWKWGKPTTGPKAAASGEKVLATNLEGTYSGNQAMLLKMPAIVLPEGKAYLQFKDWYDIGKNDRGFVAVKPDGDENFYIEAEYVGTTSGGYSNEEVDLSKYAGKKIDVAFYFISTDSNNNQGWFIDDVRLTNKSAASGSTSAALSNIPKELMSRLTNLFAASGGTSTLNSPKEQIINSAETNADIAKIPLSATVSIVENGRSTKTNPQDGSYSFKVKAGDYTLRAETYGYYPQDQRVTVAADQVLENTNITLAPIPKGTFTGKIINAQTGKPVKGAKVYVIEDAAVAPVTTDAEGNYSITAYEGKYTVQVTAENYFDEQFTVDVTGNKNVSHDLQLKPFINFSGEIGYDDGTPEYSVGQWEAGGGYAVRMSLPEGQTSAIVTSGKFMFDPKSGGTTFKVAVYDAIGKDGAPGKMIAGPFNGNAIREAGKWTVVDLSAQQIVVTGDFYMVLIQDKMAPVSPLISLDKNSIAAQRSWQFVKGGPFTVANKDFGNMMIRATVKEEALAPVITSPVDNPYLNNENVTIKGMAAPGMDVHIFSKDEDIANGRTNDDGSFSIDTVLQEGVNILKAKTITEIGSTPYSKEIKVIVDKTTPVLEITSPQNNANKNDQVITVKGTAKDDYLEYVDVNGTKADIDSNGNWTVKLMSKEGQNGINVVARDKAGNETVKSVTVNVKYSIKGITNLKPDQDLKLNSGDAVKVEFDSEVGLKKAAFRIISPIGNVNKTNSIQTVNESAIEMPMKEVVDKDGKGIGHYVGKWIVSKDIVLNGGQIEVTVEDNNGNKLTKMTEGRLYVNTKVVKPTPVVKTAPKLTADKKDNRIGKTINITFKDDAKWRGSITSITVNGKSIKGNYKIDKGNIVINGKVFTKAQSYKIVIKAKGYKDGQVTQVIIPEVKPAPTLTADKKDNKVGKTINITFKDDAKWRSSITSITVNGKSIKGNYKIDKGNIIINGKVFTKAQSYKIVIKAKGYKDGQVTQVIIKK
ncbi:S8 family serine peptidase [Bacillus sp. AFS088145]|uniref:S8 family serine peptidase n=1 Tax=Bacillus sp. AFS088145 TaxID=2033514 RepID=UPI000BF4D4EA|nr:S8 family serine peptidase [Bacillus sp. AFS088145]PFH87024.1 peptidase S8 [Bacillus sp. AFS088145]